MGQPPLDSTHIGMDTTNAKIYYLDLTPVDAKPHAKTLDHLWTKLLLV